MRALAVLLLLLSTTAHAAVVSTLMSAPPGLLCRAAITAAAKGQAIPDHLLTAIARAESGRRDEATGAMHPWPWTINAEGQGFFYETKAEAVAAVRAMQAKGMRSIDVGCMQVNLMHHPDAFPSLEQAFDPPANAAYAARFLRQLFGQAGDWTKAVGLYHSSTPELSEPYAKKVMALLAEESKRPPDQRPPDQRPLGQRPLGPAALASAFAATTPHGALLPAQPAAGPPPPGSLNVGRGLDLYRAQPVGIAARPPRQLSRY